MKRIVWKFGLIAGVIVAGMMAITVPLCMTQALDFSISAAIGYSSMVLAFLAVFFGIRSYRDKVGGGAITFLRALGVGLLIALIGCAVYVVSWEIVFWGFMPDFADKYAAVSLEHLKAKGASAETLAAETAKMEEFKRLYQNPFFNVGMTFMEVFPVALIVTLVSAAILRRKPGLPAAATAMA